VPRDATDDVDAVEAALQHHVSAYVSRELQRSDFRQLHEFIERHGSVASAPMPQSDAEHARVRRRICGDDAGGQLDALASHFYRQWGEGVQRAHDTMVAHFAQPRTQKTVLRAFFAAVLELSEQLRALALRCWSHPPFLALLVPKDAMRQHFQSRYAVSLTT